MHIIYLSYIYINIYIYIYIYILYNVQWNTRFSSQKVLGLLSFGSCLNCINSENVVAEIQLKLLNKRALSTGEPCTCEYVTLLQSFHRGTLSIH